MKIEDEKAIENLPNDINKRVINKLKESKTNQNHYFEKLTGRKEFKESQGIRWL